MVKFRTEEDLFGKVEIDNNFLYGIQTFRSMENLSFSGKILSNYKEYIKSMIEVKEACALTNFQTNILSKNKYKLINNACEILLADDFSEHFPVDVLHGGGGIAVNMNVNEVIGNFANKLDGGKPGVYHLINPVEDVNMSQSTVDACYTAQRLAIIYKSEKLLKILDECVKTFKEKSEEFKNIETVSRTCLQDALPITYEEKFLSYYYVMKRRVDKIKSTINNMYSVNLGGTVVGTGWGASEKYKELIVDNLSKVTGLNLNQHENLFDLAANGDVMSQLSNDLALFARCLLKISKDFRLLSSGPEAGFMEIELPKLQAGSSFFPGKVNPVIPEMVIQACFQVIGCDHVVSMVVEHGELDYNTFECVSPINILDSMEMLSNSVNQFNEKCLRGIKINTSRCEEISNSIIPLAVKLKDKVGYKKASYLMSTMTKEELINYYNKN